MNRKVIVPCPLCGRSIQAGRTKRVLPDHTIGVGSDEMCKGAGLRVPKQQMQAQTPLPKKPPAVTTKKKKAPRRRCVTGKLCFATEEQAERSAVSLTRKSIRRVRPEGRSWARSYKCPKCPWWHVTSMEATPLTPSPTSETPRR